MRVIHEKPPIYEECRKRFGVSWRDGIIFTYGENVYCRINIPKQKEVHEGTHIKQQRIMGTEKWWNKYLEDEGFRLEQELEAYKNEIKWIRKSVREPKQVIKMCHAIYTDLSGYMYGNLVTYEKAKELLSTSK